MRAAIVAALIAVAWVALCALTVVPAHSHDWFVGTSDPTGRGSCCSSGGNKFNDCESVPQFLMDAGIIEEVAQGYHVRMTVAQARYFNPRIASPIDEVVTWDRVQNGLSSGFAVCLVATDNGKVRCFFAPSNS